MKNKFLLASTLVMMFTISGCSNKTYDDFEDNYVESLPEQSKDGTTFHAFCWTFNQIKENLPYLAEAGFKNVLTMPVQTPKSGGASWWAYYQPLSFSIASESPLGSKKDLEDLCNEAKKYNISILADIVANHMANISDDDLEADGTPKVSPSVEQYEPILYQNRNENVDGTHGVTFHHNVNATGSGAETQVYPYGKLPDLNTANPYVQERVLSLLKECIDIGIDGFRFDAAKHIETSSDPSYASSFWENTLDVAKDYYKSKTNKELYAFGEILNAPTLRPFSAYTDHMVITEDGYASGLKGGFIGKDPSKIIATELSKSTANNLIAWVESHDEYTTSSSHYGDSNVAKLWGIISSRKDLGAIYLARPDENLTVGKIGSYAFESEYVACANRFHNRFVNAKEYMSSGNEKIFVNERISDNDQGAYVLNLENVDVSKKYDVTFTHLKDGNYYDMVTGNKVVVTNHKAKMSFDISGIAYLTITNQTSRPRFSISERNALFANNKSITLKISNYDQAYYSFNDETNKYELTDSNTISLEKHVNSDNKVNLHITLINGNFTVNRTFTYTKVTLVEGYFNIFNLNPTYYNDFELYMWSWSPSTWSKNYIIQDDIILVDTTGMEGFLLATFEKGYEITTLDKWDSNVIKQSTDIKGLDLQLGFYDASGF